jgi:tRNA(adenine34) deaminase
MRDERFMRTALAEAGLSQKAGEVPVGAMIVKGEEIISLSHNMTVKNKNSLAHAEMIAIGEASAKLGIERLTDCELFVTLEPCAMCAGAILNSRLKRAVFGAYDPLNGFFGSVIDLLQYSTYKKTEVIGGVLEKECREILRDFFDAMRKNK